MSNRRLFFGFSVIVAVLLWGPLGSSAQSSANNVLTLPTDAGIVAKLTTSLDLQQCKPGDTIEVQASDDLKSGKTVLLKKGSLVVGHVTLVEPPTASQAETMIGIVFDTVKPQNGPQASTLLLIRAIAPEPSGATNSSISEGRGMPGATDNAAAAGRVSAGTGPGGRLSLTSVGVTGIPHLRIGSRRDSKGNAVTILSTSSSDVKLKKGTQLLLKEPATN
jgi:hypothetical protein